MKKNNISFEIKEIITELKGKFGSQVVSKIRDIRFYYEGFHNKTYIGKIDGVWVQIRIPKKVLNVNYENETKIVSEFKDYLYFKDGYLIKKWFPGQDLFKVNLDEKVRISIYKSVLHFSKMHVNVDKFNWLAYPIKDQKFLDILEKYKDEELVLSHNNLKKHNILINKYGFIKLIDYEFAGYNSRYVDPVTLHLFFDIDKKEIIEFFKLDEEKFEDYIYLVQTFNRNAYKTIYSKVKAPQNRITDSFLQITNKDYSISNRFIVQKYHNQFDNRLNLSVIEDLYFVPTCVYEDKNKIIWRWLNCYHINQFQNYHIKLLAHAMRTLHDSKKEFPSYILKDKIDWYISKIDLESLYQEIDGKPVCDKILGWVSKIIVDANCHNNLGLDNVLFTDTKNIYIIDWSVAYRNNRFLDIAYMFENIGLGKSGEKQFWIYYGINEPQDFYKYRVISHFTAYLYNKILNGDYTMAGVNMQRITEILKDQG
ncbi:hypothetical protein PR240_00750 [Metamycoplasma hyosynoviae]|uniref:hypothetical protein n=1 Tax=Metamycoplasma hyosynoviae TaxID=29559 RepID=UPI002359F926|nr:hypothetical protein [Metamycoplasma hyosynoviae]MDC8916243.1 hypothetical protein [Metamycoplasma hyosynoviae]